MLGVHLIAFTMYMCMLYYEEFNIHERERVHACLHI